MQPIIPCQQNSDLGQLIEEFAEVLKTQAHTLGNHGLSEEDFYRLGLFQGVIERIRGQQSATMTPKRDFVKRVLDFMQDGGFIKGWQSAGDQNRHDYSVKLNDNRVSVIELKGCLDGNNTTIYERPAHAEEFVIWSVCSNAGADPRHNVWSGIHTRLSAEIVEHGNSKHVDGLIVWDWLCGSVARPCPKLDRASPDGPRLTTVGQFKLPPPCIYLFPKTVPVVRTNPNPEPHPSILATSPAAILISEPRRKDCKSPAATMRRIWCGVTPQRSARVAAENAAGVSFARAGRRLMGLEAPFKTQT